MKSETPDPRPQAQRTQLLRRLHAAAAEACERSGVDLDPHQVARDACRVASLSEATDPVLRHGIARLSVRTPQSKIQNPKSRPRPRRARPSAPGVVKLVTQPQLKLLRTLIRRLGWDARALERRLGGTWVNGPEGWFSDSIGNAAECGQAINTLIGECKRLRM